MNPYLESPYWAGVHHWLITELARYLNTQLPSAYYAAVEVRVYETADAEVIDVADGLVGIPDNVIIDDRRYARSPTTAAVATLSEPVLVTVPMVEEVKEGYLEIREAENHAVITAIELLSPKNKQPGKGRMQYEEKRQQLLTSGTHLVEIDLIRKFRPMEFSGISVVTDYRVLVSRAPQRPQAALYAFNLRDPIPIFPLPLRSMSEEIPINLNDLINILYDAGAYARRIDYRQEPPKPPLSAVDRDWCDQLLQEQGLRTN
jgi:Protein of unknown function (DUF4058)